MTEQVPDEAEQNAADLIDNVVPSRGYALVPLVGLGGSAGAIPALQQLLRSVPPDCGLAFVVVVHLSSEHESSLAELLQRSTRMRVVQLNEQQKVEAGTVYVIPPRRVIKAGDGHLRVDTHPLHERGRHVAVDLFFRTLADTHGPHAAAVVLSGADGDGAIGIKRIKERGGLTIAQDPQECEQPGMPRSSIATGMVDWVLPVADMASRLLAYFRLEKQLRLPSEEPDSPENAPSGPASQEAPLREVLSFLRTRTGRDFSAYKRATIVRRIARRMQVNGTDDLPGYLSCLRTRPGEAGALLQDLLISVTNFFRDPDYFDALAPHLSQLFRDKSANDAVRVWVPGCATGEEAYSLAMLLSEKARELDASPVLQIFATDLDADAIRTAREAIYPATIEADVSPERLRRFFLKEHQGYRVRRDIREMVLFAQHDILKDSPFSRLDLVSCRNLLIYLNREAQQRVFHTFHFSLVPHGLLFLGSSESVEEGSGMFSVLDKKHRIHSQRPARLRLPMPQGPSTLAQALAQTTAPGAEPLPIAGRGFDVATAPAGALQALEGRATSWGEVHFRLLELLAPPSVLVDAEHDILHLSASAGRFLQFGGGEPSKNLLRSVHQGMRIELRGALYQAAQSRAPAEAVVRAVELGGQSVDVSIRVQPVDELGGDLFLVTLSADKPGPDAAAGTLEGRAVPEPVARHLDRELERLKLHLRDTVEQYEASTEELKASNEELQAMNEELRSATEELETSREELQSINEELSTVNLELKSKVDELAHANSDIHNLMDATEIATVFLDRELHVMRYTPTAVQLFSLIHTDVGRPLADLATRLQYADMSQDARRVLEKLVPVEREVGLPDGRWFLARLLPYRTLEDRIAGVVLSFIDITERKRAEEVRLWLSAVVNATTDAIVSFTLDGVVLSWNAGAEKVFGYTPQECIGHSLSMMAPDAGRGQEMAGNLQRVARGEGLNFETVRRRKDGVDILVAMSVSPIRDADGKVIGATTIARDITAAREAAEALRRSEERLRLIVESARDFAIFTMDVERRVTIWNSGAQHLLGYAEQEVLGQAGDIIFTDEDRAAGAPAAEVRTALKDGRASDDRWHQRKDGTRFWASGVAMLMRDAQGEALGVVKILRDQTKAREAQEALRRSQGELVEALAQNQAARAELEAADAAKDRFLAVLSHELRNPLSSIASASEILSGKKLDQAKVDRAVQVIRRQTTAMKALLNDLLDVSRLRLGRLEIRKRVVTLGQVIEAAIETTRPVVEGARHALDLALPAHEIEVEADPLRLGQVFSNLIGNAAKYTPENGRIAIAAQLMGDEVVVSVADNGIGMEPTDIGRMFELFTQAASDPLSGGEGLGIGLALARSIIELHGGWIRAESGGPGQGSRFQVGLPVLRAGEARAAPPASAEGASSSAALQGERVLIVDDNTDSAWALATLLQLNGATAVVAHTGQQALKSAAEHQPAFMVIDVGLPDLSGHEVGRRIRAEPWGRPAVLVAATGWGQDVDVRESLAAGFDAHLTKPVQARQLVDLLLQLRGQRAKPPAT